MEFKFLNFKIKIKREEGPTRNLIWGILKYLSAEFSLKIRDWSGSDDVWMWGQTTRVSDVFGQKLGYDNGCAY